MIGSANGRRVGITGLGVHVPERVLTNDELSTLVDTSDEWIMERTGIRERRIASEDEALTDIARPAALAALERASLEAKDIDLLVCATVTPDMMFPTSSALLADELGMPDAAAYDLLAGCTGLSTRSRRPTAWLRPGLSQRALVVGGDVLSKILGGPPLDHRSLRRRRGRRRARARRRRRFPGSSSAPTAAAASTSGFPAVAPATSTSPRASSR